MTQHLRGIGRAGLPRRGFLLLTVVVMLAVVSTILARLSVTSMRIASNAVRDERAVRHDWAITSLRRYALDSAHLLLSGSDGTAPSSAGQLQEAIFSKSMQFAGNTWTLILADESAKLNLAHLSKDFSYESARDAIDSLVTDGRARSLPEIRSSELLSRRWEHWLDSPMGNAQDASLARMFATATQRLTLWGDGRLNVCRADEETINYLWKRLYGSEAPRELFRMRELQPPPTVDQLIAALDLRESQATLARRWISTRATCWSVWVFCRTDRRVRATQFVEWGLDSQNRNHRGYEY